MSLSRCLLLLAPLMGLAGCSEPVVDSRGGIPASITVVTEPVKFEPQKTRVEAVGTSRAVQSITLYPATSGEVVGVHFKPGERVEKGALLLELDQRDARLAVELAERQVEQARRLYERYVESAEAGATLPTTLDAARTEFEAAKIALSRARIELEDRTLKAPFAGHVGLTDVQVGDRILSSTPVASLDDRSALLVSFDLPELLMGTLQAGDNIDITSWGASGAQASGEVIEIDSRIDPATRTFVSRARVQNEGDRLRPGMSFRVRIDVVGDAYPALPELAVQWGVDGAYIWTVQNGKAQRIPVNIVQRLQGTVLVESSVAAGDFVVIEGVQRLRPGVEVQTETGLAVENPLDPGAS